MERIEYNGHVAHWAPDPSDWDWVADRCKNEEVIGFDTEFDGCDPRYESTVGRARVHVWSLAVFNGGRHPRGYRRASGVTLPQLALSHDPILQLLARDRPIKAAHNAPVDSHTVVEEGAAVHGLVNTLSLARFLFPGRLHYGLKALMVDLLGATPVGDYEEVFSEPEVVEKMVRQCTCGAIPCRRRILPEHAKSETRHQIPTGRRSRVPLRTMVPGHPLFPALTVYAAEDAERALELWDYCRFVGSARTREMPW